MKKVAGIGIIIVSVAFLFAFVIPQDSQSTSSSEGIQWYTWEEAIKASEDHPKKLFIDVYTDWCGWCKRMDKTTFSDKEVADYINANFYPVKLDAEQKEDIVYQGHTFKFVNAGRRGVHTLAYSLLDGKLGYPAYVYMDENQALITVSPGYKTIDVLMQELQYIGEGHYKDMKFEEYSQK